MPDPQHSPMPDTDQPYGPREETRTDWAVLVGTDVSGESGPHLLTGASGELHARRQLWWWQHKRPEANPRLMKQEVVTMYAPWMVAADQTPEEIQ